MRQFDPGMSDEAVRAATGRDWRDWKSRLDALGAFDLTHPEIVKLLSASGMGDWWRQMVAVGYERMSGKRAPGQRCDGAFTANASRTLVGDKDDALRRWLTKVEGLIQYNDALVVSEPRESQSEKWRYWRVDLDDGSKVSVVISEKPGGKSVIAIGHEKLADEAAAAGAKAFWKSLLAAI